MITAQDQLLAFVGLTARCSKGEVGLVTHVKQLPWGLSAVGIKLSDGSAWASRAPTRVPWSEIVALAESKV